MNKLNLTFVDTIISAKIPNKQNSLLRQVVLYHNMHNPWGHLSPSAACMLDNICSEHFPNVFVDETVHDGAQMYITYLERSPNFGRETAPWTYRTPEGSSIT